MKTSHTLEREIERRRQVSDPRALGVLVGSQLRWLRVEAGLSQAAIARRMGSHRPIISRIEVGLHDVDLATIYRYAAALGVDPVRDVLCVLDDYEIGPDGALVKIECVVAADRHPLDAYRGRARLPSARRRAA